MNYNYRELWFKIYEEEERVFLIILFDFKFLDLDKFYFIMYKKYRY